MLTYSLTSRSRKFDALRSFQDIVQSTSENCRSILRYSVELLAIGAEFKDIGKENFRLRTLSAKLFKDRDEVRFGIRKGFVVLRGLNPKDYSGEENSIISLGLSTYTAETYGRQDQTGNMIGEYI